jgi:hypothetical protein
MEAATQDMSAIIADEIAEHNKGKPSSRISPEVKKARFDGLVQLVKVVLNAMEHAEMGGPGVNVALNEPLKARFSFRARPNSDIDLVIQVDTDRLAVTGERWRYYQSVPLPLTPELFWDPRDQRWVGPRKGRDLTKTGAPWVRESAEAALTHAILAAFEEMGRLVP